MILKEAFFLENALFLHYSAIYSPVGIFGGDYF